MSSRNLALLLLIPACTPQSADTLTCGAGTTAVDGACVADLDALECGEGTQRIDDACVPLPDTEAPPLEPGRFQAPLVELQRAQGTKDHLHISEVRYRDADKRLFSCSYYFGVLNATNPQKMTWMIQDKTHVTPSGSPRAPGCNHLALDETDPNLVFTTHRKNIDFATFLSSWTIAVDPLNPALFTATQGPALQEEGVSYEGIDVENGLIYAAIHEQGIAIYENLGAEGFRRVGALDGMENAWDILVRGDIAYVSAGYEGVITVDVSDPEHPAILGRVSVGGQARDLDLDGNFAYVAAGAAGLAIVDVSDPASPSIVGDIDTPGTASGVDFEAGRANVASWQDTRVFDVSTPAAPRFIGAVRNTLEQTYPDGGLRPDITARTFHAVAFGDTLFVGNWWVPYTYAIHADALAPYIVLPETVNNIGFGPTPLGETRTTTLKVENQGTADLTLYDNWVDHPAFTVSPRQARIPPGGELNLTLTYTASAAEIEWAILHLRTDDPNQPERLGYLVGNQPGLGVGSTLPETTGELLTGGTWSSSEHLGQVTYLAWFANYCPVCATELPDLELQVWDRYQDTDLEMIALDADDEDDIGGITEYIDHLGVSFPVALETTRTYEDLQLNYDGANPFPQTVLVDREGVIRYVAVEYDPEGLIETIDQLLAE